MPNPSTSTPLQRSGRAPFEKFVTCKVSDGNPEGGASEVGTSDVYVVEPAPNGKRGLAKCTCARKTCGHY